MQRPTLLMDALSLRTSDAIAIVVYLTAILAMGYYFSRRMKSTEEYFLGGRSFPGWAIGLSMLGSNVSSITFLALPAAAFSGDWQLNTQNCALPAAALLAIWFIIPFFRRAGLTSAFEYLEDRYGPIARLYAAISFIIFQIARAAMILYLIAIPSRDLFGLPIELILIIGGTFIGLYTILGGIEAVICTDVIQTIVLLLGGILCVVTVVLSLDGGMTEILQVGVDNSKFDIGSTEWDWEKRNVFVLLLLGFNIYLGNFCADQTVIQRYAASASTREARKATGIWAVMSLPTWYFFMFLGTCLFVYYESFPDPAVETMVSGKEVERILPYFILSQIPAGVAGIVLAAVLAAAMSSLDSIVNATATVTIIDIVKRYFTQDRSDAYYLTMARWLSALYTAVVILCAIWFVHIPKENVADLSLIIVAIFSGCVSAMFLLGFFTTRVDYKSVIVAMLIAIAVNFYLMLDNFGALPKSLSLGIYSYYTSVIVNIVFAICAYTIACFRGKPKQQLDRLTVWTMDVRKD